MRARTLFLAATVTAGAMIVHGSGREPASSRSLARHVSDETLRLRAHFDSVAVELGSRDVDALSPRQRSARAELQRWLVDYRDAGAFPLNDGFSERVVPIFRDRRGVLCAMAYLIDRSGRGDIVDRVAETRNTALIGDLAGDQGLVRWLDSTGLSIAEAARIQPMYGQPPSPVRVEKVAVSGRYAIASVVGSGSALATGALNIATPTKTTGWLGVLTGAAAALTGFGNLTGSNTPTKQVAAVNVVTGTAAVALGLRSLLRTSDTPLARGRASEPGRRDPVRMSLDLGLPSVDRLTAPGLTVHVRF